MAAISILAGVFYFVYKCLQESGARAAEKAYMDANLHNRQRQFELEMQYYSDPKAFDEYYKSVTGWKPEYREMDPKRFPGRFKIPVNGGRPDYDKAITDIACHEGWVRFNLAEAVNDPAYRRAIRR